MEKEAIQNKVKKVFQSLDWATKHARELADQLVRVNDELKTSRQRRWALVEENERLRMELRGLRQKKDPEINVYDHWQDAVRYMAPQPITIAGPGSKIELYSLRHEKTWLEAEKRVLNAALKFRDAMLMDAWHDEAKALDRVRDVEANQTELARYNAIFRHQTKLAVKAAADTLRSYHHSLIINGEATYRLAASALGQLDKIWRNL